ncbi:polynucleotide adenylyltransferase PcnB [Marinobacterium arenosum]|uniref:polynucleotide adenylyltransferase PcnB n=1 Tax=Marinobacterium arenosum TaxID=2862496 RepID=UPI001C98D7D6|nr:polynucleotide adenylyltransferase PcnB [Marinobacterium arenosum]MBY4678286.1 polynucleotide adenylyltransferase PcnB [Marinobacterium arenosum]
MKFLSNIAGRFFKRKAPLTDGQSADQAFGGETRPHGKVVIPEAEHGIDRRRLDENANKVVYRLLDDGHEAYLVGGCIRDLLTGQRPKDFDVATGAHPEMAHELFRRSRLIGRRFKLLHVRFGREVIEVATFRAGHDTHPANEGGDHGRQSESGLILRDNVYGTLEEDALRRDFTVNALYYDLANHSVVDFANGYQDIKDKVIRMIGDPEERYREDPVRMLRAVRFAAKLEFDIEPATAAPIDELAPLLRDIAPARLFDESLKLFQSGHAERVYRLMQQHNLFGQLFPQAAASIRNPGNYPVEELLLNALRNTDRRIRQRKSVTPAFLYAALLWYPMQQRMDQLLKQNRMPPLQALHEAANEVIGQQVRSTAIPRRFSTPIREIWELQLRLPRRQGNRAERLMEHPRFRAAYDLLLLRENSGEDLGGLSQWWTDFQNANSVDRDSLQQHTDDDEPKRKPRRRRRPSRKRSNSGSQSNPEQQD